MALTIVSDVNPTISPDENSGQPSALLQVAQVTVTLDTSYPAGGYSLAASFGGAVVQPSPYVIDYDGAALRYLRVEDTAGVPMLKAYVQTSGAPGVEVTAAVDVSGHVGVGVEFFYK